MRITKGEQMSRETSNIVCTTIIGVVVVLAVFIHGMFNRYHVVVVGDGYSIKVDHLTGKCLSRVGNEVFVKSTAR